MRSRATVLQILNAVVAQNRALGVGRGLASAPSMLNTALEHATRRALHDAAVIVIRPRKGGPGFKYTIAMSALAKLGPMNKNLDERGRYDAVMATDGLFQAEPTP